MKCICRAKRTRGFRVGGLVARTDDHRDLGDAGGGDFPGEDGEGGLGDAVAVHQRLERQRALVFPGGGDDGFGDFHARKDGECRRVLAIPRTRHPGFTPVPAAANSLPVMHGFSYKNGSLFCEDVDLTALAAGHGTPLYVYSAGTILDHYRRLDAKHWRAWTTRWPTR